jgi:C_GCAxxG_C_C family probable redox protein
MFAAGLEQILYSTRGGRASARLLSKVNIMSEKSSRACSVFNGGFNCAQAVLTTFSPAFDLSERDALRLACAFGAGMGRMGKVCGAVTGAFMTVGLASCETKKSNEKRKTEAYRLVREFTDRFCARHGSIDCRELLGLDLGTPEGTAEAQRTGVFDAKCTLFVEDAVTILEDLLRT